MPQGRVAPDFADRSPNPGTDLIGGVMCSWAGSVVSTEFGEGAAPFIPRGSGAVGGVGEQQDVGTLLWSGRIEDRPPLCLLLAADISRVRGFEALRSADWTIIHRARFCDRGKARGLVAHEGGATAIVAGGIPPDVRRGAIYA